MMLPAKFKTCSGASKRAAAERAYAPGAYRRGELVHDPAEFRADGLARVLAGHRVRERGAVEFDLYG